ncbi:flavodoxin family protein [Leucobacter aridicollis]|uniref:flavodoxin family protein n=1 Tax=Leucobacter aridicollis TaxID=283878 RepID=UPI002103C6E9|nr:NAD(P)H-dependent oxidoreductase [Leucobacter aridicollis]UTX52185.1 NAD(P)H-dependent oxidoreductase [Leucobacter aridicollis]
MTEKIHILILNGTLKAGSETSSTEALAQELSKEFPSETSTVETVRLVDLSILPGISDDLGDGDAWPALRQRILEADVVVFATPTWLGQMTSVMRRALERLNADISTRDDHGRPLFAGKVAAALVVGNEDGAHRIVADLLQAANDLAFSVPANACTYWNGRAMEQVNFVDLTETPEPVAAANRGLAANALHLARLLRAHPYPAAE